MLGDELARKSTSELTGSAGGGGGGGAPSSKSKHSSSSAAAVTVVEQPYYTTAYLPPSPPKSRPPSFEEEGDMPSTTATATVVQATQSQPVPVLHSYANTPAATGTQHWNDLPAGFVQQAGSTAIQRKGSQQGNSTANEPLSASSSSKYPPAPLRSPLASSFAQAAAASGLGAQNGYYPHDAVKDTQMGGLANGSAYMNGYGRSASPIDPSLGSTFSNLYSRASDAVKLSSSRSSLPTHQTSSTITTGSHARRKSIAQAVVPSISTLRFVTLCALWYTSSAVSNNTGKTILNNFRYPVTLTFIQFGFVAGWCIIFCVGRTKLAQWQAASSSPQISTHSRSMSISQLYSSTWGIKKPTRKALEGTVVMSIFQVAGHIFSSMATARIPVSTVHTIKVIYLLIILLWLPSLNILLGIVPSLHSRFLRSPFPGPILVQYLHRPSSLDHRSNACMLFRPASQCRRAHLCPRFHRHFRVTEHLLEETAAEGWYTFRGTWRTWCQRRAQAGQTALTAL